MKRIVLTFFGLSVLLISNSAQYVDSFGSVDYYHAKVMDSENHLDSWHKDDNGPFEYIIGLNAEWWENAPFVAGFPIWCTAAEVTPVYGQSTGAIPGSACYFAIMACLRYYVYTGDTSFLSLAVRTGNFIVEHDLTSSAFVKYPSFPYAVGSTGSINPLGFGHPDDDDPRNPIYSIQPDKGAMLGVALLELFKITGDSRYLKTSVNIANCLSDNAVTGTAENSPWPMRVMADDGSTFDGVFDGNASFSCRLFDELLRIGQSGNGKYKATRDSVWKWLKEQVIAYDDASKWMHFFEDHSGSEFNPTQINALETVRYLLEKKNQVDPDWFNLSLKIINQVTRRWAVTSMANDGYVSIAEQESDHTPFNSHAARYGSILAMFSEAGAGTAYADTAYHSLCYSAYSVEDDGFTSTFYNFNTMAWTTDSFGDFLYHFMEAMAAVPQWAGSKNHLLKSSGTIRKVNYVSDKSINYTVYDESGTDKMKLVKVPVLVKVNDTPVKSWSWNDSSKVLIINRSTGKNITVDLNKSISLNPTSLSLTVGGPSGTITATILPDTVTVKSLIWRSSSPDVASVTQTGVVTPFSAGTSEIIVSTADETLSDSCTVTVVNRMESAPPCPVLLAPANNETNQPDSLVLKWESSSGAVSYGIQVSLNHEFSSTLLNQTFCQDTTINLSDLSKNTLYYWRVNATNEFGTSPWSGVWNFTTALDNGIEPPVYNPSFGFKQNYPNPFTSSTTIEFYTSLPCEVEISLYNVIGEKVCEITNEYLEAGSYKRVWIPPSGLRAGIYYCKMLANNTQFTRMLIYNP